MNDIYVRTRNVHTWISVLGKRVGRYFDKQDMAAVQDEVHALQDAMKSCVLEVVTKDCGRTSQVHIVAPGYLRPIGDAVLGMAAHSIREELLSLETE